MTWNWGAFSQRSLNLERRDAPDIADNDLLRLLTSTERRAYWLGAHRSPQAFFSSVLPLWPLNTPITILDVRCGLGGFSKSIVGWARRHKVEVQITAVEKYGRIIDMAREKNGSVREIQFEVRGLNDPVFLQAQQFDYVVSEGGLHSETEDGLHSFLVTANRLSKRGIVLVDFLRDLRGALWMKTLAKLSGQADTVYDAELAVKKGFTIKEMRLACEKAGLKFAAIQKQFGYRFSVTGERGLVFSENRERVPGFAGV